MDIYEIADYAARYAAQFVNGSRIAAIADLSCLDHHSMAESVAITAKIMQLLEEPEVNPSVRANFVYVAASYAENGPEDLDHKPTVVIANKIDTVNM